MAIALSTLLVASPFPWAPAASPAAAGPPGHMGAPYADEPTWETAPGDLPLPLPEVCDGTLDAPTGPRPNPIVDLFRRTYEARNPDDTVWRVTYWSCDYESEEEALAYAAAYAAAGRYAYEVETLSWGFLPQDPDGILEIIVQGTSAYTCFCLDAVMWLPPRLELFLADLGVAYGTIESAFRTVIGHEYHHHLQGAINPTIRENGTRGLTEGAARFVETLLVPGPNHQPQSAMYAAPPGASLRGMQTNPEVRLALRAYDAGLLWGHLYERRGGLPLIRALYEATIGLNVTADERVPRLVEDALQSLGAPLPFSDVQRDFAVDRYLKAFNWTSPLEDGPRDWATFLPAVRRQTPEPLLDGTIRSNQTLAAQAAGFHTVPLTAPLEATVTRDQGVLAWWVWRTSDGAHVEEAQPSRTFSDPTILDLVLIAIGPGNVTVEARPV